MRKLAPAGCVERRIHIVRGEKVMLDSDLASLYGVPTKRLNEQVRRNIRRFPRDFMFRLRQEEFAILMSQNATSSSGWGGRRKMPRVFTELGVAMLSSVLNSERAIQANMTIMRVFQRLRRLIAEHRDLSDQVAEHERHLAKHDQDIQSLFAGVPQLHESAPEPRPVIGFEPGPKDALKQQRSETT